MSPIDLNTNRETLLRAHKEVSEPNSKTNWALYGYEGKTDVLKLVEKGDGGIEELVDELSSGKIMYAFCKVKDPNSSLPKYVLINWQGEGVQEMRKGSCVNHFLDVSKFLRGAHLTVHARTEDDVDEEDILKKVAKSSGSNYGFHKEKARPEDSAPTGPVGSVYKKTLPHAEIKMSARDKFWEKTQDDEKQRVIQDNQRKAEARAKEEREAKEREAREAKERESKENERMKKVRDIREAERRASETDNRDQEKWEQSQSDALKDEEERRKRSDQLRRERAAEAKALVSQRDNNPRSAFEQRTSQFDQPESGGGPAKGPPPPRKLKHGFMNEDNQAPVARKQPIQLPTGPGDDSSSVPSKPWEEDQEEEPAPRNVAPSKPARHSASRETSPPAREPSPPRREPSPPPRREPSPPPRREPSPPPREPSPPPSAPVSQTTSSQPKTRNLLAEGMPKRQPDSDEEADDDDWGEDAPTPVPVTVTKTEPAQVYEEDEVYDEAQSAAPVTNYPEEELYDEAQSLAPQLGMQGDKGIVARALFDYQAAEENEISFDPDDLITNIDMIDDGWWIGFGPDGRQGMFPANYVEVIST